MSEIHNIVILGGQYAGLRVAHGLLKALPNLKSQTKKDYKISIISNTTHFWFSVGAPRAMLRPYPKDNMDSFIPVSKGFTKYSSDQFEFIHAQIESLDTSNRTVAYKVKDEKENTSPETSTVPFSTLVICTGSSGPDALYALQGSHLPTLHAYEEVQNRLPSAKTVMVVGGGSAGTETAGELGHLHGTSTSSPKDITILSGSTRLLSHLRADLGARAEEILKGMGVKVIHDLRVTSSKKLYSGAHEVSLSDGTTRTVDLLMTATGRVPTASFLPDSFLDKNGRVVVDNYMRLPSANLSSAYAFGDVCSISPGGLVFLQFAGPVVVGNIIAELSGKGEGKEHKPITTKDMQIVPVGPDTGVGAAFGWWVPGFLVRMMKGKTFMFARAPKMVDGTA